MTPLEVAKANNVSYSHVVHWRQKGVVSAIKCNDKGDWLYHPFSKNSLDKKYNVDKVAEETT